MPQKLAIMPPTDRDGTSDGRSQGRIGFVQYKLNGGAGYSIPPGSTI
jgi:hypothetical protein